MSKRHKNQLDPFHQQTTLSHKLFFPLWASYSKLSLLSLRGLEPNKRSKLVEETVRFLQLAQKTLLKCQKRDKNITQLRKSKNKSPNLRKTKVYN